MAAQLEKKQYYEDKSEEITRKKTVKKSQEKKRFNDDWLGLQKALNELDDSKTITTDNIISLLKRYIPQTLKSLLSR